MKPTSYRCKHVSRYCCNKLLNAQLDNALSLIAILNFNYFSILKFWLSNVVLAYQIRHINFAKGLAIIRATLAKVRRSRPDVLHKKGVLKNFTKFTGKHLCQSFFFNKVAGRPAALLKKRPWHRCFPVNCVKILRTSFLIEKPWWLLLKIFVFPIV